MRDSKYIRILTCEEVVKCTATSKNDSGDSHVYGSYTHFRARHVSSVVYNEPTSMLCSGCIR